MKRDANGEPGSHGCKNSIGASPQTGHRNALRRARHPGSEMRPYLDRIWISVL